MQVIFNKDNDPLAITQTISSRVRGKSI